MSRTATKASKIWRNRGGTPFMITPGSRLSIGVEMAASAVAFPSLTVWPSANRAIFVPFVLSESVVVRKLFYWRASGGNNVDIGIYDANLVRLVSSGSQVMAGAGNNIQSFDIVDTTIGPGQFYLAMAIDSITTPQVFLWISPTQAPIEELKAWGLAEQAAAFPLPANATLAVVTANFIPYMGLTLRTLVN